MFAGIVRGMGCVLEREDAGGDLRLVIGTGDIDLGPIEVGASIAVNGVCLTATAHRDSSFEVDVSAETLRVTTLGRLRIRDTVNLEPSLRFGDPVDGHLVYGHVDGIGRVIAVTPEARSIRLELEAPRDLARFIAAKGSVAVDGVSLTVNGVAGSRFTVNIIPLTRELTVISTYTSGTPVNIEVDMMARYLERLVQAGQRSSMDLGTLESHGFFSHD